MRSLKPHETGAKRAMLVLRVSFCSKRQSFEIGSALAMVFIITLG
ncbi:MAG: hypothetical protein ACJAYR_003502 [Sneathiella sp.]|jgi:hypothetical protein